VSFVAALYIDPLGPYPSLPNVDCWDISRDATQYTGPYPVVAHPPCGPWSRLKHFYKGNEHLCAIYAIDQVRAFGGVLEHPADSSLWKALPAPGTWDAFGCTIEVEQCNWGHPTRKRTWLYCVRTHLEWMWFPPPKEPTHSVCNGRGQNLLSGIVRKRANALQIRLTPPAFASWLVALARTVKA
jgi:hypothetical protein